MGPGLRSQLSLDDVVLVLPPDRMEMVYAPVRLQPERPLWQFACGTGGGASWSCGVEATCFPEAWRRDYSVPCSR